MAYGQYLFAAGVIIFLLEVLAGRHRGIYRKEDIAVTLLCQLTSSAVTRPLAAWLIAAVFATVLPSQRGALSALAFWPAFIVLLIVTDLAFYWGHRLAHQSQSTRHAWLWKLHRTHHAAKYLNVTVTARINPFWSFVVPTAWVLGLAAYLGMGRAAAATLLVTFGWNLLTHSHFRWDDALRRNRYTRWPMSIIEHIIVTPGIHHTHHGYGRDGKTYRNFAVMFAWIDWLFGTLHSPQGRPAHYGLPGPQPHWAEEVLYPVVRMSAQPPRTREPPARA